MVCSQDFLAERFSLHACRACVSVESQIQEPSFFVRPYVVPYALFRGNRRLGKKPEDRVLCVFSCIFPLSVSLSLSTEVIRERDRRLERLERRVQSTAKWLRNSR